MHPTCPAMIIIAPCPHLPRQAEPCQSEMSRAVRVALWDYKPGAALTQPCDADVTKECPKVRRRRRCHGCEPWACAQHAHTHRTQDVQDSGCTWLGMYTLDVNTYRNPPFPKSASHRNTLTHTHIHIHTHFTLQGAHARSGSPFTIGVVGRCLSKALVQHARLQPQCRALVLVAAPKVWTHVGCGRAGGVNCVG